MQSSKEIAQPWEKIRQIPVPTRMPVHTLKKIKKEIEEDG